MIKKHGRQILLFIAFFWAILFAAVKIKSIFNTNPSDEPKVITDNKQYSQDSIILQHIQQELHKINSAIEIENRRRLQMVIEQDKVLQQLKIQNEIIRQKINIENKRIDSLDAVGQFNEMSKYIGF